MKRIAKQSSRGSGRGSRLRLTILLATAAAFLLVPAAQAFANETVKLTIKGTGSGSVHPDPGLVSHKGEPPMECNYKSGVQTGVCEDKMSEEGGGYEQVWFNAWPAVGSEFVEWTVEPEGGAFYEQCEKVVLCGPFSEPPGEGGAKVEAEFADEPGDPLAVNIEEGKGTVVSNPAGIVCIDNTGTPKTCWKSYTGNPEVELTASPAAGYAFSSWSGCTSHEGLKCKVIVQSGSKPTTVKAKFIATPSLTIEKPGTGQGKVSATGINCDENCSKASSAVKAGTSVTVKATPAKGSEVAVFESPTGSATGANCPAGGPCTFTISENSSVKVKFVAKPTSNLTVNLTGPAAYKGKVTGEGEGKAIPTLKGLLSSKVNCGSGCTTQTEAFFSADTVTLTATPAVGYTFGGWSLPVGTGAGTCTGTNSPCTVPTSSAKTLSAQFE